jgi:hypothetical protein
MRMGGILQEIEGRLYLRFIFGPSLLQISAVGDGFPLSSFLFGCGHPFKLSGRLLQHEFLIFLSWMFAPLLY